MNMKPQMKAHAKMMMKKASEKSDGKPSRMNALKEAAKRRTSKPY